MLPVDKNISVCNFTSVSQFVIEGGHRLAGRAPVLGSKNAALPLLAAALLTEQPVKLRSIPIIADVEHFVTMLLEMGVLVQRQGAVVDLAAGVVDAERLRAGMVGKLRGSILLFGALLGRQRYVRLPRPGGDVIGARPIDVHVDAFRQLGAKIVDDGTWVAIDGRSMQAGTVVLREFSVTATENVMLAAARLPGTTTIHIAAAEPHVRALGALLAAMGAAVDGLGTHTISITGREALQGASFTNIPDMLEAGLFILLAAATHSRLTVEGVPVGDLRLFFKKLDDIGVEYRLDGSAVHVAPSQLRGFRVQTLPHPGIATDLQAPFSVLASQAQGTSLIHDPMYEGRLRHCSELVKMGAAITVCDPHRVIVQGPTPLRGRRIQSLDIRSGATLIVAGLAAQGTTIIEQADIIDRGYERLDERLRALGARITRTRDGITVEEVSEAAAAL